MSGNKSKKDILSEDCRCEHYPACNGCLRNEAIRLRGLLKEKNEIINKHHDSRFPCLVCNPPKPKEDTEPIKCEDESDWGSEYGDEAEVVGMTDSRPWIVDGECVLNNSANCDLEYSCDTCPYAPRSRLT